LLNLPTTHFLPRREGEREREQFINIEISAALQTAPPSHKSFTAPARKYEERGKEFQKTTNTRERERVLIKMETELDVNDSISINYAERSWLV
jgi:hypothetical protein